MEEAYTRRFSGIVVPRLVSQLSYDPRREKPNEEQLYETTYKMAETMVKKMQSSSKPRFNREHEDNTPAAASGRLENVYIEGESLMADFVTTDDTAELITSGALTELSMSHFQDPTNPEDCSIDEVSLVFTARRPGSDIIAELPPSQEEDTRLHISASGTVTSTMHLKEQKKTTAKRKEGGEEKEEHKEEKEEKEEEERKAFRPRRKNEDEHEYMVKKIAAISGLSGTAKAELIEHLKKTTLEHVRLSSENAELAKGKAAADQKLLHNKARTTDTIIPILKMLQNHPSLNKDQRTRIAASGTLETLQEILSESSSSPMDTSSASPPDTTTTTTTPPTPLPVDTIVNGFGEAHDRAAARGRQFFDENKGSGGDPRISEMYSEMAEMKKRNKMLEDILLRQEDEKEEEEARKKEDRLQQLHARTRMAAAPQTKPPPVDRVKGLRTVGAPVVRVKGSAAVVAPSSRPPLQRTSQSKVQSTKQRALVEMRKAKAAAAAEKMQVEEHDDEDDDQDCEKETKEPPVEEEAVESGEEAVEEEEEEFKERDDGMVVEDTSEKVIDIDAEAFGELDKAFAREDPSLERFRNSQQFSRYQKSSDFKGGDRGKQRRRDPSQYHAVITREAQEAYKKKMMKVKPKEAARIKVSASATIAGVIGREAQGVHITPGLVRETLRRGLAYTTLVDPNLEQRMDRATLDKLHRNAAIPRGTQFDSREVNWGEGRCRDVDDWARQNMVTGVGPEFQRIFSDERDQSVALGGQYFL